MPIGINSLVTTAPTRTTNSPKEKADPKTDIEALRDSVSLSRPGTRDAIALAERVLRESLGIEVADEVTENGTSEASEGLANTIFAGITGSIFGAYALAHPDLTESELNQFIAEVQKGIDTGSRDAREILGQLDSLSEEVDTTITDALELLDAKLEAFYDGIRQGILGTS